MALTVEIAAAGFTIPSLISAGSSTVLFPPRSVPALHISNELRHHERSPVPQIPPVLQAGTPWAAGCRAGLG